MASFVLNNASVVVNSVNLSDHVRTVTIDSSQAMLDDTAMGDAFTSNAAGLASWSCTIEFLQDYAASKVDATISACLGIGTAATTLLIKPVAASVSSTNPSYSGSGILESYTPIGGSVGDQAMTTATFQSATALTRATS